MPPQPQRAEVLAAGVVVWRSGPEVLLVHRPRYDDWSFPKGKLDPGERAPVAAVREVEEETGLRVRLGPPLPDQTYPSGRGRKRVHYWVGWAVGDDDVEGYEVNDEIDDVRWVPQARALDLLTYRRDRETLARAVKLRKRTRALVVLRHAKAVKRKAWEGPDPLRPLTPEGQVQAAALVPLLAAYGVEQVVSSSSTRCLETVVPYAGAVQQVTRPVRGLTEEDATPDSVNECLLEVMGSRLDAVVCSHRPVLPDVFEAIGVDRVELDPAACAVVHHRKRRIRGWEVHAAP